MFSINNYVDQQPPGKQLTTSTSIYGPSVISIQSGFSAPIMVHASPPGQLGVVLALELEVI